MEKHTVILYVNLLLKTLLFIFFVFQLCHAENFDLPYKKFQLKNGLRLIVHEDKKAPIVAVNIGYHVGSKNEKTGTYGFANFIKHLMFRNSKHFGNEYRSPFDLVGATDIQGTVCLDRTSFSQTIPSSALDMTLWMESERMKNLFIALNSKKLNEQKEFIKSEKNQIENQPYGKIWNTLLKASFPDEHPYSWSTIDTMEDVERASLERTRVWFNRHYGAANAVIVIAGDIESEKVREKVEFYFGNISSGKPQKKIHQWVAKRNESRYESLYDQVPKARFIKSWNVPSINHEDSSALELIAGILGGSIHSRIHKRLVVQEKLVSKVSMKYLPFEISGLLTIVVDVENSKTLDKVKYVLSEELDRFLKLGPDKDEIELFQAMNETEIINDLQRIGSTHGKATLLAEGEMYSNDPTYRMQQLISARSLKKETLKQVANEWLSKGDYNLDVLPIKHFKVNENQVEREGIPNITKQPQIKFPEIKRFRLSNGLQVVVVERKGMPLINVSLYFETSFSSKKFSKLGMENLTTSMFTERTNKLVISDFIKKWDQLGMKWNVQASLDTVSFRFHVLKEKISPALTLFTQILLDANYFETDFNNTNQQWLSILNTHSNHNTPKILSVLPPFLYGERHPYSVALSGKTAGIQKNDLLAFKNNWLRPDNATLIFAGAISLEQAKLLAHKHFNDWFSPPEPLSRMSLNKTIPNNAPELYLIHDDSAESIDIFIGKLMPSSMHPEAMLYDLINAIVVGDTSARLNKKINDKIKLRSSIVSFTKKTKGPRPLMIHASVSKEDAAQVLSNLINELQSFATSKLPTSNELKRVIQTEIRKLPSRYETLESLVEQVEEMVLYRYPDNYANMYVKNIQSISSKNIQHIAKNEYSIDKFTWVIMGNLKKIDGFLETSHFKKIERFEKNSTIESNESAL